MRHFRDLRFLAVTALLALGSVDCVRDTKYYDTLGVPTDADERVIKRAYKKQALKWHPDRHINDKAKAEERFKDIAAAYETLSDPEKRKLYDQFGEEGLKGGGPGAPGGYPGGFQFHGDPFDIFNAFFGGGGPSGGAGGGKQFHFSTEGGSGGFQFGGSGFPGGGFPGGAMGGGGFGGMGGHGAGGRPQHRDGGGDMYEGDNAVLQLDDSSFPSSSSSWVWLVEFYAPWCGHCQQLAPRWKKVASSLKGVVKVAAINCDEHKALCQVQGIRGYPSIKALAPGSSQWQDYQGDRSAAAISNWATSLIGNAAAIIRRDSDLKSLLERCGGGSSSSPAASKRSSKSGASWGLCLLLVSQRAAVPSLWKALSVAFRGKVAFGFLGPNLQVDLQQLGQAAVLGSASSKVVAICNGDVRTAEAYTGTLKSEPLQRYINTYAAGKRCALQVVLDSSTDLSALKVPQLKALVIAKGIDCTGCFEKSDYVAALKGWLETQQQGNSHASGKQEL